MHNLFSLLLLLCVIPRGQPDDVRAAFLSFEETARRTTRLATRSYFFCVYWGGRQANKSTRTNSGSIVSFFELGCQPFQLNLPTGVLSGLKNTDKSWSQNNHSVSDTFFGGKIQATTCPHTTPAAKFGNGFCIQDALISIFA